MRLSARNILEGKVTDIREGAVNAAVTLQIGNDHFITSNITMSALRDLGLAVGSTAYAIIKASSVILGVSE